MYDAMFFESQLLSIAREHSKSFRWSSRMTSAGGKTIRSGHRPRGQKLLKFPTRSRYRLHCCFRRLAIWIDRSASLACVRNRLQAMQRILEHELIHLAEMLVWEDSNCAADRFHAIAHRFVWAY